MFELMVIIDVHRHTEFIVIGVTHRPLSRIFFRKLIRLNKKFG